MQRGARSGKRLFNWVCSAELQNNEQRREVAESKSKWNIGETHAIANKSHYGNRTIKGAIWKRLLKIGDSFSPVMIVQMFTKIRAFHSQLGFVVAAHSHK